MVILSRRQSNKLKVPCHSEVGINDSLQAAGCPMGKQAGILDL